MGGEQIVTLFCVQWKLVKGRGRSRNSFYELSPDHVAVATLLYYYYSLSNMKISTTQALQLTSTSSVRNLERKV